MQVIGAEFSKHQPAFGADAGAGKNMENETVDAGEKSREVRRSVVCFEGFLQAR